MSLDHTELQMLATYNGEKARGLVHDQYWVAKMKELQHRFDRDQKEQWEEERRKGNLTIIEIGGLEDA